MVTENPMLIESRRLMRRFLRPSGNESLNMAVMILAGLALLILTGSIWNAASSIPPISVIIAQTGLYVLVVPSISHGVFAGERERRSWDLLLVAPIRKSQIVIGKLLGCIAGVLATTAFFFLPVLITVVGYQRTSFLLTFLAELLSLSFGLLLIALGFAVSARAKRAFSALGGTIALIAMLLVVLPYLIGLGLGGERTTFDTMMAAHPFYALWKLYEAGEATSSAGAAGPAILVSLAYLLGAFLLFLYTVRTLESEDGDGAFRLRRKHA